MSPLTTTRFHPAYLDLLDSGELRRRVETAHSRLETCTLCGVGCRARRLSGKIGGCRTGERALLASYGPHMGEEAVLTGWNGSGTIFFGGCSLRCQFCQNWEISQVRSGHEVTDEALAQVMLHLQDQGCHNINLVTPSHVIPQILAAVEIAAREGLRLPLVYNTGGYDTVESLRLLDGVIDIYMPDMKYGNAITARRYSKIIRYPEVNQAAVREMYRQVGNLQVDENGLAARGLMVRHLVLPNELAGTGEIAAFLAREISPDTYLNVMDQYHPAFNAKEYSSLARPVTAAEYAQALKIVKAAGIRRI